MIKMIALDLDNTLLMEDKTIPDFVKDALRQAADRGVLVVIASGRMYPAARAYANELGTGAPVVSCNGADIRDGDGSVIFNGGFDAESLKKILRLCSREDIYAQLYWNDSIVVEKWTKWTEAYPDAHRFPVIETGSWLDLMEGRTVGMEVLPSPKALLVAEPEEIEGIMERVKNEMGDMVSLTRSADTYIEVLRNGVSKREGLKVLAERFGIDRSEVMACGDNLNDLEMVSWAGVGVAVANAVPQLKEAAAYVARGERSQGVAEAVRKYVLEAE